MNSLHKKVQIITLHKEKKALLLLEMKADRGFGWQNVTGSVESGEDIFTAAKRELLEETGIEEAELVQLSQEFKFHDRWGKDVIEYCFAALTNKDEITISKEEHQGFKWLPINEVQSKDFKYESNFLAFQEAINCLS
ncbi:MULTISPECIES: NUDIX domain-containing protein [Halobacteriovorax]|uniref:NUDIX domain-containing protein n=1 Tax=Halobacteriovorax vibrionivorans TaxID=2152716 RepID=A0ABY0ILA5_9BACT|nr:MULTISPECIES: NUDIX domain-containing protein [Halobacteriovorax]RZF22072.1 NUDIX domain-containing protein [Halobacteriovorax vibrionivorans]TGD46967.1 NUDIX domain-containing protein [Halobacteriovorax sp. Y22]